MGYINVFLSQNVASIDAASDVQVACWRLLALDMVAIKNNRERELAIMPRHA